MSLFRSGIFTVLLRVRLLAALFLLSLSALVLLEWKPLPALAGRLSQARTVIMDAGGRRFHLEVAATPEALRTGLMFRERLDANRGMLFLFETPQVLQFWMKNCKIPLDIVFMRQDAVQTVIPSAPPCKSASCPTYSSRYPSDRAVELPAGTARALNLHPGSVLRLHAVPPLETVGVRS